jgi:hypothetical protein
MDLREVDLSSRTFDRAPQLHPALQRSELAVGESTRILALERLEKRSRF